MITRNLRKIPKRQKIAYAAPAFALAVVGIPVYVYIPKFYTDVVGVHIAALGTLVLGVRIFDALTDPLLGFLSDKTITGFGRRRPFIAVGSPLLALAIFFLFHPPQASAEFETFWFGFWIFALFLFWTVVQVPYESLGPELTSDYDERTTLFGLRDGALIAGTLLAASSPSLVGWALGLGPGNEGERRKFFWIAIVYGPLLVCFCWWCVLAIRERPAILSPRISSGIWTGLREVARNRPFIILLVSYTIGAFGSNLPATLILYYVQYVLESTQADFFLFLYFSVGILCLPAWVMISGKIGKKAAWIASMAVNTGAFTGVFFLGPGDAWIYGILVFFSGIGLGATLVLPSAMQPDVIDYDELLTGERREGRYIGLWSISKKLSAALGVGAALFLLGASGYVPNEEQSEQVKFTLRVLYALVPSFCNIVALVIALAYPVTRDTHRAILEAVSRQKAGQSVLDPLNPQRTIPSTTPLGKPEQ